jgi:tetratricopeptide (TPR) repeat protein
MSLRCLVLSIVCGVALTGLACSSPEEKVARHVERAQAYDEAGQTDKAMTELQAALKLAPQSADLNLRIAKLLESNEQWPDALFFYDEAYRLEPRNDDAALGVARVIRLEDPERADRLIDEVLERNPGSASAHVLRSDVMLKHSDLNGALASALTAAELDPGSPRVALQVAIVRKAEIQVARQKGQPDDQLFEEADAAFAHALELARERDQQWTVRAAIERARLRVIWHGFEPSEIEIYRSAYAAVKGFPNLERRILEAATQHASQAGDSDFENWALSRLVEANPASYDRWLDLARLAKKRGESELAVLDRMIAALPDDPQAQITYADQLVGMGKRPEAVAYLEKVLPNSTAPAVTLAALVQIHLGGGELDAALDALQRLRTGYPDTGPADQAEANVANAQFRFADAIVALERWTTREETVTGFGLLADTRLRVGNARGALDAIDRALALSKGPRPDLQRLRGRALVRLGEYRAALKAFSRSRARGGPLPPAFLPDLATAFYALGRDDEARKALERVLAEERPPATALLLFAREEIARDPKAVRQAMERGHALYPGVIQFVAMLANADLRDKQPEAALKRVREAAAELPDSAEAQMLLVKMLITRGLNDEAVSEVDKVQARWPGYVGVAELYLGVMTLAGRSDQAFDDLSRQEAAGQLSPFARVLLARLHAARGESEEAIRLLRAALEQVPDLPAAANDLAYQLARRGEDLQEATELAQEARASRPDSPEIADTLGYVYMQRRLAEAALVQFDAALELSEAESPGWATAQFHRGLALRDLGRRQEAVAAVERALASGADFAEVKDAHQALAELAGTAAAEKSEGS